MVVYSVSELLMVAVCTRPVMVVRTWALTARGPARTRAEERIVMACCSLTEGLMQGSSQAEY